MLMQNGCLMKDVPEGNWIADRVGGKIVVVEPSPAGKAKAKVVSDIVGDGPVEARALEEGEVFLISFKTCSHFVLVEVNRPNNTGSSRAH